MLNIPFIATFLQAILSWLTGGFDMPDAPAFLIRIVEALLSFFGG